MSIGRNVTANYLGQAWTAVIGLVFIPAYIRYMGVESFGLIGVFTLLQAWLALLDMGMTPTLNREMARFTAGAHTPQSIRDLLRSLELIALAMSAAIGVLVWAAADWLAADWLRVEKLPLETVSQAIALMGFVVAMRFLEGLYRGAMLGLQQQVLYNAANAFFATLRAAGAVAVLAWVSPTIEAYFLWQGLVSMVSVPVLAAATYLGLPASPLPTRFSTQALIGIRRYAGGMMINMFLALLLTQVDKILLSQMLSLEDFGYYMLAAAVAAALTLLINPITQAYYPRFSELLVRGDSVGLARSYHLGAQLVTGFVAPGALILVFFGQELLALWADNPELAHRAAPLLALMALGTLLNGLMHIPYMIQLAYGWPGLAAKVNGVAVAVLMPAILWVTPRYGAIGAAWVWLLLNASYVLISMHFMYLRLLREEKLKWYLEDILLPLAAASAVAMVSRWLHPDTLGMLAEFAWLLATGAFMFAAAIAAAPELRSPIFRYLARKEHEPRPS